MKYFVRIFIGIFLFSLSSFTFVSADCIEGEESCLFGWNHSENTWSNWNNWSWLDPISEYWWRGFMMNENHPLWSGKPLNWANGWRMRSFSKEKEVSAVVDMTQRAPSTSQGGSFKVFDLPSSSSNRASWWMWYDAKPLSTRWITHASTDRMSFYVKTENMKPLSTPTKISTWGYHVGTYLCWDDGCNKWEGPGNQHYYHYLALNPWAWIHVELDQHPQHRRQGSGPVLGNNPSFIESGKNYFEHMSRFYMEIRNSQTNPTTMHVDELKYYSTQDSVEPNQNEESITSVWVGNWPEENYWEIWFSDNSFGEDGMRDTTWSTFEIKWSTSPITNANYDSATLIEPMFYTGTEYTDGEGGAFRRSSAWERGAWTRFKLPDQIEMEASQIYFAIKDISIAWSGAWTKYPWNKPDGHNAPSDNIRLINYHISSDIKEEWVNDSKYIAVNRVVAQFWKRLDLVILKYRKDTNIQVSKLRNSLLKGIDEYITLNKTQVKDLNYRLKWKALKVKVKKNYKELLIELRN